MNSSHRLFQRLQFISLRHLYLSQWDGRDPNRVAAAHKSLAAMTSVVAQTPTEGPGVRPPWVLVVRERVRSRIESLTLTPPLTLTLTATPTLTRNAPPGILPHESRRFFRRSSMSSQGWHFYFMIWKWSYWILEDLSVFVACILRLGI